MKKGIWFIIAVCFLLINAAGSEAGYKRTPWGSKSWEGPGRPPHWSPERILPSPRPPRPELPIEPEEPIDPEWGVVPPGNRPGKPGGYWKDKYNRWHYHNYWRSGYIYYRQPAPETIIIEREQKVPVYVPVQPKPSRLQCGGRTVARSDPQTGEIIIEYVTSSQDCP